MARGRHYAKLSLSNAARLSFSDLCILLFMFLSLCRLCVCVFLCSHWSLVDFPLIFFCPADHVPDWQPRVLLGMVEARSVNVKKTTTTTTTSFPVSQLLLMMSSCINLLFSPRGHEPPPTLRDRVSTHTSAFNTVRRFPVPRYAKRPDVVALYAIGLSVHSFSFPPCPLRTAPSRFPNYRLYKEDKTSSWHLIGFPNGSNIGSTISCRG